MNFKDKICIVTGGANGIGEAIVYRLAKDNASIIVCDIDIEAAEKLVGEIRNIGTRALAIQTDVTMIKDTNQLVEEVLENYGRIDILINNAGGSARERKSLFHQSTEEVWDYVIGINLKGVLNCTRSVINQMISQRSGKIVSISSCAGIVGDAGLADYSAAKAGIVGFTMALAKEVAPYRINVNSVSPGPIGTPAVLKSHTDML